MSIKKLLIILGLLVLLTVSYSKQDEEQSQEESQSGEEDSEEDSEEEPSDIIRDLEVEGEDTTAMAVTGVGSRKAEDGETVKDEFEIAIEVGQGNIFFASIAYEDGSQSEESEEDSEEDSEDEDRDGDKKKRNESEEESEEDSEDSEDEDVELEIVLDEIIIFNESGDSRGYDKQDSVVDYYIPDTEQDWFGWRVQEANEDGAAVYNATAKTTDGYFEIVAHLTSKKTKSGELELNPNEVKLDFNFYNFDWGRGNDESLLAFAFSIKAPAGSVDADNKITFGDGWTSTFSWAQTVVIDSTGGTAEVIASKLEEAGEGDEDGEKEYILYFTFGEHSDNYNWDPTLGYSGDSNRLVFTKWILLLIGLVLFFF